MKIDSIDLLVDRGSIHDYVMNLWADGPIAESHRKGGMVHDIVDRFGKVPRFFYEPSEPHIEWTHFSSWWGGILLCDYDNPYIRDLRYLHEIYHAATLPYLRGCSIGMLESKNFANERQASTLTEMAIYLEMPGLRALTFDHPIFMDRFLYPSGDFARPDTQLLDHWKADSRTTFDFLLEQRRRVIEAPASKIDADDPQVVWLRRYGEQGKNWVRIWSHRYGEVEDAMLTLIERSAAGERTEAGHDHLAWLLSDAVSGGTGIPFHGEARAFRNAFDALVAAYDRAMTDSGEVAVRGKAPA
ncbi:hypothetical protein [Erythrobacter mangrovi]|uniref:Uncharacterized protein n=1 Tax=Erythrobacter mangrovi TaxID=2739433 RepID=A0A7D4BFV9_9SPHN|nr:hypothetical protein [Erythrobacter mangrovi]QKG70962.1 hypothetical protein HQR01_06020 [Erythrobacter mangrovi]